MQAAATECARSEKLQVGSEFASHCRRAYVANSSSSFLILPSSLLGNVLHRDERLPGPLSRLRRPSLERNEDLS